MNVLDIFSGIGGFSLGLERAGMRTVAFCEIEPFARAVLRKHWPSVPCYTDVRELTAERLRADGISVDVICGGFPCQDLSVAGKGAGLAGERSGLWFEYARIIDEVRPLYVIVENVAALLSRGLGTVLGDLASLGYDAEWHCIPASAAGAPHRRDRIWIVANASVRRRSGAEERQVQQSGRAKAFSASHVPNTSGDLIRDQSGRRIGSSWSDQTKLRDDGSQGPVADTDDCQRQFGRSHGRVGWGSIAKDDLGLASRGTHWAVEPNVGRVADGIPARVDRLTGLGNAVVPQIPEIIGRAIMRQRSYGSCNWCGSLEPCGGTECGYGKRSRSFIHEDHQ